MALKILSFLFLSFICSNAFAMECSDDEKFIPISENQIGYSMYKESIYAEPIQGLKGGKWALKNIETKDVGVIGSALCLDSEEFNNDTIGSYCYCRISEIDGYKVLSDWVNVRHFANNVFDSDKKYSSEFAEKMAKQQVDEKNIKDCKDKCTGFCQGNMSALIKKVRGYYVCDKALYKKTNVMCVVNNKFLKSKYIHVFDDIAEINLDDTSIILTRDKTNTQTLFYVGEFEYDPIYLKIENNKIFVGNKTFSMEECM